MRKKSNALPSKVNLGIRFFTAKNGSISCSANGTSLHSSYDPEKEGERFAASLGASFYPEYIIVTEPALSYCETFLRKRFPSARLCAVRYSEDFSESDKRWDIVFNAAKKEDELSENLFASLGEEGLCSSLFASWYPSARAFPRKDEAVWREIKNAVDKGRDVLFTRSAFSSRWILNAFFICKHIERVKTLIKGNAPLVVAASGPSLTNALPLLARFRKYYFLIAVSSALSVLNAHDIVPDLCFSTDGGFYAKAHLTRLAFVSGIPLALAEEAACGGTILSQNDIVPLSYGDGFASKLFKSCGIPSVKIERNGTVSGSALSFAKAITDGPIFFCGLDLAPAPGLQHAEPNELDLRAEIFDVKTFPKETRASISRFTSGALRLYRKWFQALPEKETRNVYRLAHEYRFSNTLGAIGDVDFDFFEKSLSPNGTLPRIADEALAQKKDVQKSALDFAKRHGQSDEWLHEFFPAEYISWKRETDGEEKGRKAKTLEKKSDELLKKIERLLS